MLKEQVESISKEFILEAQNSPRLLTDMAAMEMYLAESYGDRVLIELLQNADDAESTKAVLIVEDNVVIFANNGRPFTENDLVAICRSGSSQKIKGKDIGYRGVGFKSTTSIATDILISSNGAIFTFSKNHCAKVLGVKESDVPTIRIPFSVNNSELGIDVNKRIQELHQQGYNSIFIFRKPKLSILNEEVKSFDSACLLFLRNLSELRFNDTNAETYVVKRDLDCTGVKVLISSSKKQDRWVLPFANSRTNIAFKTDNNGHIIDCDPQEAVFHCFLPTLDQAPFRFKVNADFSTDPSRKHLTLDDNTHTKLHELGEDLFDIAHMSINSLISYDGLLSVLSKRISYAPAANSIYNEFVRAIVKDVKIQLNDGAMCKIEHYKQHDEFFSTLEKHFISQNCQHFSEQAAKNFSIDLEQFIEKFSKTKYSIYDYFELLVDNSFAQKCDSTFFAKIYAFVLKGLKIDSMFSGKTYDFNNCILKGINNVISIALYKKNENIDKAFIESLKTYVKEEDWNWFAKISGVSLDLYKKQEKTSVFNTSETKVHLSKWRSAEQQCADIENSFGNNAICVGNQNLGYDVRSTDAYGKIRYIEVKSVTKLGDSFVITNNEYTAAHQYVNDYYLCLIAQNKDTVEVVYIQNPLEKLQLEKRARAWEWFCDEYQGEKMSISIAEISNQ